MLIFINGPFGVGKTTVAKRLVARLPHSRLYDPERIGFVLRRILPPARRPSDYQDLALWRSLTVTGARLLHATSGRTLIIPMTIWHPAHFAAVLGGLRAHEPALHHFTLTATAATLTARIRGSNEAVDWRLAHLERCLDAFASPDFATHIATDHKTPDTIAAEIHSALPASPRHRSPKLMPPTQP